MKADEKDRKQSAELNEEALDGVTGGLGAIPMSSQTMQFQPGMQMNAQTMQYRPGANEIESRTLEQHMRGAAPANPVNPPKNSGGMHSV